jgi:Ran GTPase-activating protein (RanGAP) involved in mRNA processing and transport
MDIGLRDDVMSLFDALAGNTHIQKVDLSLNELDDECVESLSLALIDNQSIYYLNLANNAITSEGAEYLIGTLESNDVLREVDLEGNAIDDDLIDDVYEILDQRPQLSIAASAQASNGEVSLGEIVDRLFADDPELVELSLDNMDLAESPEFDALVDALTTNEMVSKLSLNATNLDDANVESLTTALADNKTLTYISLRDNQITDEGCESILECLETNETLCYIDLSGNQVSDELIREVNDS